MNTTFKFGATAALALLLAAPIATAQESGGQAPGQNMQNGDMMGGDMSNMEGMMPMMKMMQQMSPMMEQCTEMMAAMTDQMKSAPNAQDDNG